MPPPLSAAVPDAAGRKIDSLTSLRFFAAALIVIGHSRGVFGIPPLWFGGLNNSLGVSFFYVMSGFILTYVYRGMTTRQEARHYLVARFARIWPAHFVTFLLAFAVAPYLADIVLTPFGLLCAALNLALLQAWVPIQVVYFSYNAVAWSISAEVFFYLMFIWLIRDIERTWLTKILFGLGLAGLMIGIAMVFRLPLYAENAYTVDTAALTYISPASRIFEFIVGMAAAVGYFRLRDRPRAGAVAANALEIGCLLVALAPLAIPVGWFDYGMITLVLPKQVCLWLQRSYAAPAFALFIMVIARQEGIVSSILRCRTLVVLGEISYAVYLLHQLLIRWWLVHGSRFAGILPDAMAYLLFWILTLVGSFIIWRFVETPARRWLTGRLDRRPAARIVAAGA
ncbi:MAG: acyltransferase [Acetobacteraceae bacterium]